MSNTKKLILSIFGVLFLLATILIPIVLYIIKMGNGLSSVSDNWGDFGSYLGGTISSITGSISLVIIAISLVMQVNDRRRDVYARDLDSKIKYIDVLIQRTDDNLKYFDSEIQLKQEIRGLEFSGKAPQDDRDGLHALLCLKRDLLEKHKHRDEVVELYSVLKNELYEIPGCDSEKLATCFYKGVLKGLDLSAEYKI
ncbi:hypothetical protein EIB97_23940 [Vibrio parahaemolyticus]|nr:hypothetical protein [Vibrio parahaemolyticus]